ncbi:MAG: TIM barrel protein [Clostridia bacterium]|nr:TIM barrel protein [Clostridia bacterium]
MKVIYSGFADEISPVFDEQLATVKKLGMNFIEIRGVDGKNVADLDADQVADVKRKLDQAGVGISAIGSPIGKIGIRDDFDAHLERFERVMNTAEALGTRYIRVFSFFMPEGEDPETHFETVCERLSVLIERAAARGLVLLHENERDIYGEKAPACLKLMQRLACDNFRATFDPANFVQAGQNVKEAYEMLYPYIEYVHIKDARFEDKSVTPAGYGDGEVEYLLKALADGNYSGFLSVEPHLGDFVGLADLQKSELNSIIDMEPAARFELAFNALKDIVGRVLAQKRIRLGIVGYGNIGSKHCRDIVNGVPDGVSLVAICDHNPDKLALAKKRYGRFIACFDNIDDMLASGLIDCLMVCTPHYSHPDLAIKGFEAGMNVLVEKPICVYTSAARRLNEAAAKSGKVFGIMYNQRTNPAYAKIREMIKNGELGDIKRIAWIITTWYRSQSYYDSGGWRATWEGEGGGVLLNQDPHQLDLWQWIYERPKRIYAFAYEGVNRNIEVENDVTAFAEYENGATGVFITSTHETPGTNRLEISATKGKLVYEDDKLIFTKNAVPEDEFNATHTTGFGEPDHEVIEIKIDEREPKHSMHPGIFTNFASAVLKGTELLSPGEEGILGLSISNAIHLSAWTGEWTEPANLDEERFEAILNEKIRSSTRGKKEVKDRVLNAEGTY